MIGVVVSQLMTLRLVSQIFEIWKLTSDTNVAPPVQPTNAPHMYNTYCT
jgi:hypothetical protein